MAKEPSTHHHPSPRMGGRGVPPKPSLELASACEEASGPLRILHRTEGPSLLGGGWAPRQPRSAKLKPDRNRTPSGTAGFQAHETRHTAQDTCPPAKRSCLWGERVHFPNQKERRGPEDHSPSEELRSQGGRAGLGAGWPQHCSGVQPARRGGGVWVSWSRSRGTYGQESQAGAGPPVARPVGIFYAPLFWVRKRSSGGHRGRQPWCGADTCKQATPACRRHGLGLGLPRTSVGGGLLQCSPTPGAA